MVVASGSRDIISAGHEFHYCIQTVTNLSDEGNADVRLNDSGPEPEF